MAGLVSKSFHRVRITMAEQGVVCRLSFVHGTHRGWTEPVENTGMPESGGQSWRRVTARVSPSEVVIAPVGRLGRPGHAVGAVVSPLWDAPPQIRFWVTLRSLLWRPDVRRRPPVLPAGPALVSHPRVTAREPEPSSPAPHFHAKGRARVGAPSL